MRVRITKRLSGSIEGIQLGRFKPGSIYDVTTSLATYLLCERMAEPVAEDSPALGEPDSERRDVSRKADKRSKAADRPLRADQDPFLT
jgi:hypothetical protein